MALQIGAREVRPWKRRLHLVLIGLKFPEWLSNVGTLPPNLFCRAPVSIKGSLSLFIPQVPFARFTVGESLDGWIGSGGFNQLMMNFEDHGPADWGPRGQALEAPVTPRPDRFEVSGVAIQCRYSPTKSILQGPRID